jgi:hypothetical protein
VYPLATTDKTFVSNLLVTESDFVVAGTTTAKGLGTPGAYQATSGGDADAFVARLSLDLKTLGPFTYLGGSGTDSHLAAELDGAGRIDIVLSTTSTTLPLSADGAHYTGVDRDFYWAALSPNLAKLDFATYFGSPADDVCWGAGVWGGALP